MTRPLKAAARPRAACGPVPRCDPEKHLCRFGRPVRPAVRCLASRHARLADLAVSFPGLLVALAVPRLGFRPAAAISAVVDGKPLAQVAALAAVPLWLRKLPPEAFHGALPSLPEGDLFRRQIGNHLPKRARHAREWLGHVAHAFAVAHEPYALWIANVLAREGKLPRPFCIERIGVWAWHSLHEGGASALLEKRWSPAMDWRTASELSRRWIDAVECHCTLAQFPAAQPWLKADGVDGFEFIHLQSFAELVEEGQAMQHCVGTYGDEFATGQHQFWSVRRDGKRVATVALSASAGDNLVHVSEIRGFQNGLVQREAAFAVRRWLNSHGLEVLFREPAPPLHVERLKAANRLWKAYRQAKRGFPRWLPAHEVHWM